MAARCGELVRPARRRGVTDGVDDIPEAVAVRLARSRFLHEGNHRFVVLTE